MSRSSLAFSPRRGLRSIFLSLSLAVGLVALCGSGGEERVGAAGQNQIAVAGYPYSGDTFVFVIDRSCSMGWVGDMDVVKGAVTAALGEMDSSMNFSLVAFSSNSVIFSSTALPATPGNLSTGMSWVNSLTPSGSTCMLDGLTAGLAILNASGAAASSGSMFVFADGAPNCPGVQETLDGALAANFLGFPIHTFLPPGQASDPGVASVLQALSDQNNGFYVDMALPIMLPSESFLRGDANGDASVTIADAVAILFVGFGLSSDLICELAGDTNSDQQFIPVADAVYLLNALFVPMAPPIAAPHPGCGFVVPAPNLECAVNPCP